MKIELREDSVQISGYVNAVERESKILHTRSGEPFVEKIQSGAFKRSLSRNNNVKLLLNHDKTHVLGSTNNNLTLIEDNIGLRATATITDKDVIEKAKNGELSGWSFGFCALRDNKQKDEARKLDVRNVSELDLFEVSILDNTKVPAYDGTLIEARNLESNDELIELRVADGEVEIEDNTKKEQREEETQKEVNETKDYNYKFKNRYYAAKIKN